MTIERARSKIRLCHSEDRDFETGHGWRDIPFDELKFMMNTKDSSLKIESYGCDVYIEYSYFYIVRKSFYLEHHYYDELRTDDLTDCHPDFLGVDNMGFHIEFKMTPKEVKSYLENLGIKNGEEVKNVKES